MENIRLIIPTQLEVFTFNLLDTNAGWIVSDLMLKAKINGVVETTIQATMKYFAMS